MGNLLLPTQTIHLGVTDRFAVHTRVLRPLSSVGVPTPTGLAELWVFQASVKVGIEFGVVPVYHFYPRRKPRFMRYGLQPFGRP